MAVQVNPLQDNSLNVSMITSILIHYVNLCCRNLACSYPCWQTIYFFSIGQQQNVYRIGVNISAITVLFNKTLTAEVLLQLVS